eukprot:EG_transcript_9799
MTPHEALPGTTQSSVTLHMCCSESIALAPALADRPQLPLPRTSSNGMVTVVLDLDNTLVFTRVLDADSATVLVTLRPYLSDLLHWALGHCEVFIWTAGRRHYAAHAVQRMLDYFRLPRVPYLITRDDEGWYSDFDTCKDVHLLGRDMDCVVLVEDSVPYARQSCDNCVIVPPYRGEPTDDALLIVRDLLRKMVAGRGGLGVPQFLREHVRLPLLVPTAHLIRAYDWAVLQAGPPPAFAPALPQLSPCGGAAHVPAAPAPAPAAPPDGPPAPAKRPRQPAAAGRKPKVRQVASPKRVSFLVP